MSSLVQSPSSLLSHCSSTSSPPSFSFPSRAVTCLLPINSQRKRASSKPELWKKHVPKAALDGASVRDSLPTPPSFSDSKGDLVASSKLKLLRKRTSSKPELWKKHVPKAALDGASVRDSLPTPPSFSDSKGDLVAPSKLKLLSVVSGLNRGLAASEDDLQKADAASKEIEAIGGPVDLSVDLDKLQGRWKLVYSSAFSSRTLGGSRPGPPTGRLIPITLGQVFQRIDILSKDFDNIVELQLGTPWPIPPVELTATLAHKFELIGSSTVKIIFEKTSVKTTGNLSQLPPLEIPQLPDALRPQSNRGSGEFEVTYLDADMRITRGDRGELRVFVIS